MCKELIERLRGFSADHAPDGWPAIQMKDITRLCDAVDALNGRQRVMWNLMNSALSVIQNTHAASRDEELALNYLRNRMIDTLAIIQVESNNVGYPHLKVQAQ